MHSGETDQLYQSISNEADLTTKQNEIYKLKKTVIKIN